MNPIQKVLFVTSLLVSLITLAAQYVGGDMAALLIAIAVSVVAPILLPKMFGIYIINVEPTEAARRPEMPPSATSELSVRAAKEGFSPTKAQYLEAMDKDIENAVAFMDKLDDLPAKHMFATNINKMRASREMINKMDDKDF